MRGHVQGVKPFGHFVNNSSIFTQSLKDSCPLAVGVVLFADVKGIHQHQSGIGALPGAFKKLGVSLAIFVRRDVRLWVRIKTTMQVVNAYQD